MKRMELDNKEKNTASTWKQKCFKVLLLLLLCFTFVAIFSSNKNRSDYYVLADEDDSESSDDSNEDSGGSSVNRMENDLNIVKRSKQNAQELLEMYQSYKVDVVDYIDKLDDKLLQLEDDLINMQQQQDGIQENLDLVQKELKDDKITESKQYAAMKLRVKYLYEHGNYSFLDALAGSTSFGDMLNRSAIASQVQDYDSNLLKGYRESLQAISDKEAFISNAQQELAQITLDLEVEKDSVDALMADKSAELKTYNDNIEVASKLISSYESAETQVENAIAAAESAAASASSDDEEWAEELPEEYTGGQFIWPVPGHYNISSPFGYRIHPLLGTRRLHGGIDISCPTGSGVYAGGDGVVTVATYSSSAGNYVMISHGGGLCTVYMHNSKLLVSKGDKVSRGDKIALSGSTGWSTGPHCHFSVRKNGNYVNPKPYLQGKSSDDDYSASDVEDTASDNNKYEKEDNSSKKKDTSKYTTEADDQGDKGSKSSDLKDDSDPDSE